MVVGGSKVDLRLDLPDAPAAAWLYIYYARSCNIAPTLPNTAFCDRLPLVSHDVWQSSLTTVFLRRVSGGDRSYLW